MSESTAHINLVRLLAAWISDSLLGGDSGYMLVDEPNSSSQNKPPNIYSFIPDVYVPPSNSNGLIIGEAKTKTDIEKSHTIEQFEAFLRGCAQSDGSLFVIAVPWDMTITTKAIVNQCKINCGAEVVTIKVLERLPRW